MFPRLVASVNDTISVHFFIGTVDVFVGIKTCYTFNCGSIRGKIQQTRLVVNMHFTAYLLRGYPVSLNVGLSNLLLDLTILLYLGFHFLLDFLHNFHTVENLSIVG